MVDLEKVVAYCSICFELFAIEELERQDEGSNETWALACPKCGNQQLDLKEEMPSLDACCPHCGNAVGLETSSNGKVYVFCPHGCLG